MFRFSCILRLILPPGTPVLKHLLVKIKEGEKEAWEKATSTITDPKFAVDPALTDIEWCLLPIFKKEALVKAGFPQTSVRFLNKLFGSNERLMMMAVQRKGCAIRMALDPPRRNKKLALTAVEQDGMALHYVWDDFKNEKDVVLAAVFQNGEALKFAGTDLRADPEVVRSALISSGIAIRFASEELRSDPKVVKFAMKQNGQALQFASETLRLNKDFVLPLVSKHGWLMKYVKYAVMDEDVCRAALASDPTAVEHIPHETCRKLGIQKLLGETKTEAVTA